MLDAITWQVVVVLVVSVVSAAVLLDAWMTHHMKKWERTESNRQKIRVKEQQSAAELERELAGLEGKR